MTIVGKVLVFFNFIFALAIVYLIAQVFITRDNWRKKYEEQKNIALIAEQAYKDEKIAHQNDVKGLQPQSAEPTRRADEAEKQRDFYKNKYDEAVELHADLGKKLKEVQTNHTATLAEIGVLRDERNILIKQAEDERKAVLAIQQDLNIEKRRTVENKIEADSFKQKAERMQARVEELEKQVTTLSNTLNSLGPVAGKSVRSLLNPPPVPAPADVYGTVTAVATSGITVISLGSDSGISAGNKLEVLRIDEKNPRNSIYMGELIISRTEPKQSVGQFYPKPGARAEEKLPRAAEPAKGVKGDIVSTGVGNK
jgi:hypothetical protein